MLKHVVMIRLDPEAAPPLEERLDALEAGLLGMPAQIPEILGLEVGRDVVKGARSAHLVLIVLLDGLEALERYRVHPAHRRVVEALIQPTLERIVAVDYEI